jgi:uncharacterized tellurite resistance protein B-like protein
MAEPEGESAEHPARSLDAERRIQYMTIVAAIVYADRDIADAELRRLADLCAALDLDANSVDRVMAAAKSPAETTVAAALAAFHDSDLRYALLSDIVTLCYADGKVSSAECDEVAELARALHISTAQAVLIGRYVEEIAQGAEVDVLSDDLAKGLAEAEKKLPPRGVIRRLWSRIRGG